MAHPAQQKIDRALPRIGGLNQFVRLKIVLEHLAHLRDRGITLQRIAGRGFVENAGECVVDIDAVVLGQANILVGDPVHHLIDVLAAHRRLPGQQLVEQQPGGEHVGRLGAFPPFDVFGCHVRRRAHERLSVTALRFNARSDAEIHHARHVRAVEQDVVRFEIAVNDACCVRVRDRVENGDQDGNRLHRR